MPTILLWSDKTSIVHTKYWIILSWERSMVYYNCICSHNQMRLECHSAQMLWSCSCKVEKNSSILAGHRGACGRVMAKKTKRQLNWYLDHNTFSLCHPYSELMLSFKLEAAAAFCILSVLLCIVYFIHKAKKVAVTHLTDMKITLAFLHYMPLVSVLCFFLLGKPMFY